jgi:hypothetical protein
MTFKPAIWYPIAVVLSVVNLVAAGFAIRPGEGPWHATIHVAFGLAFGLWALRLRPGPGGNELSGGSDLQDRLEGLEAEVGKMRQELSDAQERLDFAERLLAQGAEARRVGPQR